MARRAARALQRFRAAAALAFFVLVALPASAQVTPGAPPRDTETRAADVVTRPLSDANIRKQEIPPVLMRIAARPYAIGDLKTCAQIAAAVAELDAVLSPDVDAPPSASKDGLDKAVDTVGAVAGGLIPFGGLIREVSGANRARRDYAKAVLDGYARRGFLKGVGQSRSCKPPAAPR